MRLLVADVSDLGLGHLSQLAPVLNRVRLRLPEVKLVLRTNHSPMQVRAFLQAEVEIDSPPSDAVIYTSGPSAYRLPETTASFRALHNAWSDTVEREAARLVALNPALVLSNVSYLSLAAAARIGVRAIALCSINWSDFVRKHLPALSQDEALLDEIDCAYRSADLFLQPQPHMPMPDLPNGRSIGPIARLGLNRRYELRVRFGIRPVERLVLVTFGGVSIETPMPIPHIPSVVWIIQGVPVERRSDIILLSDVPLPFIDVLASVDVIVGKDSYGVVAEAACNGVRLLVLPRDQSMEACSLLTWAEKVSAVVSFNGELGDRSFVDAVRYLLDRPVPQRVEATGVEQAAQAVAERL